MNKSLAVQYRPTKWEDVTEQKEIVHILQQQIASNSVRGAYCFVGAAGTGKTTCARIFANEMNDGKGSPIEMDAASNNGVDDVREISSLAKTQPIDGGYYKVFILDEAHMFSAGAWAAMLKLIEEPPARCVFILCTTDYWKIPKTIQSRCQRFQFQRISQFGIVQRLKWICDNEGIARYSDNAMLPDDNYATTSALKYIAKIADGCMRDGITMLDKCLAYSKELTMENVTKALGLSNLDDFVSLTDSLLTFDKKSILSNLERMYADGVDIKQFMKDFVDFVLDVNKYLITGSFDYINIPRTEEMEKWLSGYEGKLQDLNDLLAMVVRVNQDIKWDSNPLYTIQANFILWGAE